MVTFSQQATTTPAASGISGGPTAATRKPAGGDKKLMPLVAVAAVVLLIGGGYYFWKGRGGALGGSDYNAVFLTNNQVYFGKIAKADSNEVVLRDVYYLITKPPLQTQTPEATPGAQPKQPEYTLIKLGQEMHGPTDEMRINRTSILFIESLKEDGQVVQTITQLKAQQEE